MRHKLTIAHAKSANRSLPAAAPYRFHIVRIWLALCCVAAPAALAADGVYKWTDSNGRVHYSDMPPPKVKATKLKKSPAPVIGAPTPTEEATAPAAAPKTYVDQEVEFRKRRAATEESAKEQQEKQQRADQARQACADSRSRLHTLEQGGRVYRHNEKGEAEYFDDKRFAQEIAKEKKYLDQNCKT